ncbi:hypothetical protein DLAC_08006 [Tieghemostelium lacteum]|uniref:Ubiquitin-like domain-containing protein n=1 Tax=Tieghemostelium lacteum TaxID=361077 RepID=A0A151ZAX5_TIELA|nr:hypothetical protein DLAC_08006 [Tieghemostelium lacteum]|eukprot:KYQ91100.1 hypothetical protein DLAC_08006 [Tieghemostelium lacteum]
MKVICPSLEKTIEVEVEDDQTLFDLKQKIQEKTGTPPIHQLIKFGDKAILSKRYNKKKLSQLELNNSSSVTMIYELEGGCGCGCDLCGVGGGCRCAIM